MNKLKLILDIDSINEDTKNSENGFCLKIKSLAEHCVNYMNGHKNKAECNSLKYFKEFNFQESKKPPNLFTNDLKVYKQETILF